MNKKGTVKIVTRKPKPQVLHEQNVKGQHRLVLVNEEGNLVSRWFENHQIGFFEGLFFSTGSRDNQLKGGVFRQQMVESRRLPDGAVYGGELIPNTVAAQQQKR